MNINESLAGQSTTAFRPIAVPRHIVQQRFRPTSEKIPSSRAERNQMFQFVRHYVAAPTSCTRAP